MTSMILSTRAASAKIRYLMKDISKLVKVEEEHKWDMGNDYHELRELARMNECDSVMFFQSTKRMDGLWIGILDGTSIFFKMHNVSTVRECNFPVNVFVDCGYVLMFSKEFEEIEHLKYVKDVVEHVFKSNETKDKALCFFYLDGMIWVRCYKIGEDMEEIGPRVVLEVVKVFEKCFSGNFLYKATKEHRGQEAD
ncbi:ribosome biogenesis protein BRX1 [Ordospora colligata]|uniref:Ribosome biogenesis protein BRX1 n=1 Tax=Ordospora colligata OC4 TaxID=1354746 RepID=A0A0B2UN33_9MICR|nr:ribosome biogenesis protein BRX1 [Ordospora colligata OC4]KHN70370.1 ribosome biogenesis protein BRX1 [Ordospora colligata OC4]TBU17120.1 ribosome biogenesis protein BRX1 [Ordospora colligata]TBU17370.1 ribosome biogenesis protein BRX1 [Ordospora colligata]TBU19550.1 ribosome biogenesis protein BRX1 [Ordospora colligata]